MELNLLQKDLSNTYIADHFDTKIILVADIEKGGVFASIYGTIALMKEKFKKNLIGVVINKFRGDRSLFDDGVRIIEEDFGIKVLGVLPYKSLNLGFEDSQSLQHYKQQKEAKIHVGVIAFPHMSNFNDFEPLILDDEVRVEFITGNVHAYDVVILPGSKRVVEDLLWMRGNGLFDALQTYTKEVLGICGGYEMMFQKIHDDLAVESDKRAVLGLGWIDDIVSFGHEKVLKKGVYEVAGLSLQGYEIHFARSEKYPLYFQSPKRFGTFLHGIFDNDSFRNFLFQKIDKSYQGYNFFQKREEVIESYVTEMGRYLDMDEVLSCIW